MLLLVCARLFSLVELLLYIRRKVESGKLSPDFGHKLEELYYSYQNAILQSGNPNAHEVIRANMAVAFDRMLLDAEDPFILPPLHKAIREPFDYYKFGQNYIRPLVDFRNSYVGNIHLFQEMEQKLEQVPGFCLFIEGPALLIFIQSNPIVN
ncbi:glycerol-3-phosphate acyltransferase [Carex littledalei]|uniref:glycerol-3-phosphate 1-O-acyltransferase n=1 Tax=Carex littledalei TaxID=544730 RepID=A0A833R4I9_9POAL|nr:glycerol-3-phosphate acyltransferase [Carex littledalei]